MKRAVQLAVVVGWLLSCGQSAVPTQPIQFNHSLHMSVELADDSKLTCFDCHPGAERGSHAGLPALTTCLRCHMRPQGDPPSDQEREVRRLFAGGDPFHWTQVTRNPSHIYFSHGAHVTLAKMDCSECHGDVTQWTKPPTQPVAKLRSMAACMGCHRKNGVSNLCGTCHQ